MSWTVTRSPAQGTRRMILVYQIGVAHRVSLQGVELAKSGSQIRIFSGRTADMSVLANHKTAQVRAVCFSGVQARTLPIALMTERMCRRLVVCARCFAEVCVYQSQSRPLDGRTSRTSGILDCIWVKDRPKHGRLAFPAAILEQLLQRQPYSAIAMSACAL